MTNIEDRRPTTDEIAGISWWNALSENERSQWLERTGSATVANAWKACKAAAQWPSGSEVVTTCPDCGHADPQPIQGARDLGIDCRDAHCSGCGSQYHIEARGGIVTANKVRIARSASGLLNMAIVN